MSETLSRSEILRLKKDVERVRKTGRRVAGQALYLRFAPSPATDTKPAGTPAAPHERSRTRPARRIAFLLPRAVKGGVRRSLLRRRLRELYRRNKEWFPEGHDYLLYAAPDSADLGCRHLRRHMENLTRKLRDDCQDA